MKKRVTQRKYVQRVIKQCLKDSYGKAGYTNTADKFYKLICTKLWPNK